MAIIADRGLFVRLLVQSGRFDAGEAETLVDAIDATTREPATKADLAELQGEIALLGQRTDGQIQRLDGKLDASEARLGVRIDAIVEKLLVRLGGLILALFAAALAAIRLMFP